MWMQRYVLREKEGGGEGGGSGGVPNPAGGSGSGSGGSSAVNGIAPEVQSLIDKAVNEAVTGLKNKNGEVIATNKQLKEQLAKFDGIDPEAVHAILKRFSDDEEASLIKAGKIDEVLNKRTERMKAGYEKDLKAAKDATDAANKRAGKFTQRVLENHIRAAASTAGLHMHAVEDALFRAKTVFGLNEDGDVIALEEALGKDGKPLTLKEWFTDMKEKAPHWFPAIQGGGAQGGGQGNSGKKTMTRSAWDAASPAERMAHSKAGGVVVD